MSKFKSTIGVIGIAAILGLGGYCALAKYGSATTANTTKYAKAYEAHALNSPFNLLSKTESNGTVSYFYQVSSPVSVAVMEIQKQFSGGGYQNNAKHVDTKSTVYRDLITGDISVTATVAATPAGTTGVTVRVTQIGRD